MSNMTGARRGNVSVREHLSTCDDKPSGTWQATAISMTRPENLQSTTFPENCSLFISL